MITKGKSAWRIFYRLALYILLYESDSIENEGTENPSIQVNTEESSTQADTGESNTEVQIASKSKRKVIRPAYLKDFV